MESPASGLNGLSPSEQAQALQNLSAKDKTELNQFLMAETQKAQVQSTIHSLTDTCFRKCVTAKISSGQLDRYEEPCLQNCVNRFLDANLTVIRHLEQLRGGQ